MCVYDYNFYYRLKEQSGQTEKRMETMEIIKKQNMGETEKQKTKKKKIIGKGNETLNRTLYTTSIT